MVICCSAYGCNSQKGGRKGNDNDATTDESTSENISFHSFPLKNRLLLKKWVNAVKRKNFTPTSCSKLCNLHFEETDFEQPILKHRRLKPNAVPSIFSYKKTVKRQSPPKKIHPLEAKMQKCEVVIEQLETLPLQRKEDLDAVPMSEPPNVLPTDSNFTMKRGRRYCSVKSCMNNSDTSNLSFFRFPKDPGRCRQWIRVTGRADFADRTAEYLHVNCGICADHFESNQFMNSTTRNRLVWNAVPTLTQKIPIQDTSNETNILDSDIDVTQESRKRKKMATDKTASPKLSKTSELVEHNWCAALFCLNTSSTNQQINLFPFPRDSERCKIWVRNAGREDLLKKSADYLNKRAALCADHFEEDQFVNPLMKKRLIWDAVPTIFKASAIGATTKLKSYSPSTVKLPIRSCAKQYQKIPIASPEVRSSNQSISDSLEALPETDGTTEKRKPGRPPKQNAQPKQVHLSADNVVQSVSNYLPECASSLLKIYLRQLKHNSRWTKNGKRLAIILYVHFYHHYRTICKWFKLPSVKLLEKWLLAEQFFPGIHTNHVRMLHDLDIFERCKESTVRLQKKAAVLVMHKVKLQPNLVYNCKFDRIEGLQDLDYVGKTKYLATHAVVFTAKGLMTEWRLPVGYYPISKWISIPLLAKLVFETLYQLETTGLHIRVLVCSSSAQTRGLLEYFAVSVSRPFIYFMGRKVMVMFDPPGLLKTLLYSFKRQDISFGDKNNVASWKHVEKFYAFDSAMKTPLVPELTCKHMEMTNYKQCRTKIAADVFRYKVGAALSFAINSGTLPKEANATAEFIRSMAEIYDCFSGTRIKPPVDRPTLCLMSESSPHTKVLSNLMGKIRLWSFVGETEPRCCLQGWHLSITTLIQLWFDTQKCPRERTLNTKTLRIRDQEMRKLMIKKVGHSPPTSWQCRSVIQELSVGTLLKPVKLKCLKLEKSFFPKVVTRISTEIELARNSNCKSALSLRNELQRSLHFPSHNSLSYIAGYIVTNLFEKHKCDICQQHWAQQSSITNGAIELYILWMENLTGVNFPTENIVVPSDKLIDVIKECQEYFLNCFANVIHMDQPLMRIVLVLRKHFSQRLKDMCLHKRNLFLKYFVRYQILQSIQVFNSKRNNKTKRLRKHSFICKNRC